MTNSLILSAILDLVAILNCPMMPIWHYPDFKSGYLYLLISAKKNIFYRRYCTVILGSCLTTKEHSCQVWSKFKTGKLAKYGLNLKNASRKIKHSNFFASPVFLTALRRSKIYPKLNVIYCQNKKYPLYISIRILRISVNSDYFFYL